MLWKIHLYRRGETISTQSGVIVAPTREDAAKCVVMALGQSAADYIDVDPIHIEELHELPQGALYLRYSHA